MDTGYFTVKSKITEKIVEEDNKSNEISAEGDYVKASFSVSRGNTQGVHVRF